MKYYDVDGDGNITYEEFIQGTQVIFKSFDLILKMIFYNRDELTERKKKMVDKAFRFMDKDGSGKIDVKDIINIYDVSKNKDYIDKKKTREEILKEFLSSFEGVKRKQGWLHLESKSGMITTLIWQ